MTIWWYTQDDRHKNTLGSNNSIFRVDPTSLTLKVNNIIYETA